MVAAHLQVCPSATDDRGPIRLVGAKWLPALAGAMRAVYAPPVAATSKFTLPVISSEMNITI
jgi:hypothetical protein